MAKDIFNADYVAPSKIVLLKAKSLKMAVTGAGDAGAGNFEKILAQNIQHSVSRQARRIAAIGTATTFSATMPSVGQLTIQRVVSDVAFTEIFGAYGSGCWINPFSITLSTAGGAIVASFANCKIIGIGGSIDANNPTAMENVTIMCGSRMS